jgi:hypothetical protein
MKMKNLKSERELSMDFLRVTEAAAIESAKTMGQGDRKYSDHVAVEAMREVMDTVPMRGRSSSARASATKPRCSISAKSSAAAVFTDEEKLLVSRNRHAVSPARRHPSVRAQRQ